MIAIPTTPEPGKPQGIQPDARIFPTPDIKKAPATRDEGKSSEEMGSRLLVPLDGKFEVGKAARAAAGNIGRNAARFEDGF